MSLQIQPIDIAEAFVFVAQHHRHHRPPQGYKLCIGVNDGTKVVGVLIAGRPVARHLDDGVTLEVTRCCTDGTRNACSILYAAAWKTARELGYCKMITYTLPEEGGASLRALTQMGWKNVGKAGGTPWNNGVRTRADDHPQCVKTRWEVITAVQVQRFRIEIDEVPTPGLFDALGDSIDSEATSQESEATPNV